MGTHRNLTVAAVLVLLASGFGSCFPTGPVGDGPAIVPDAPGDAANDAARDPGKDGADLPGKDAADGASDAPAEVVLDLPVTDLPTDAAPTDTVPSDAVPTDSVPDGQTVACWGADRHFPTFDRSCVADGDCGVALHQTDCCGSTSALGIAADRLSAFDAAEAVCRSQYPGCGCAARPPVADDGLFVLDPATIGVACRGGQCATFATDACDQAAAFESRDTCSTDGDCALAFHQVNCCGTQVAWGIASGLATDFGVAEASCRALLPGCKCAQQATQAQDGNASWAAADFAVSCQSGHCRSRVEPASADTCAGTAFGTCGDPGLSCQCCPAGGPAQHCLCSTPCKSSADCTDPARPACNQVPGADGFCAPADFACCWMCL